MVTCGTGWHFFNARLSIGSSGTIAEEERRLGVCKPMEKAKNGVAEGSEKWL